MPTIVLVLRGPVTRSDVQAVCDRVRVLLERVEPGSDVCCDVARLGPPDAAALDTLARIQLLAKQLGRRVRFRHARAELRALVAYTGLTAIIPCGPDSPVRARGQPEQREQGGSVQEEGDAGDPVP